MAYLNIGVFYFLLFYGSAFSEPHVSCDSKLCNCFHLQLGNHGSNLTEEELETHTISAWKEGKWQINRQVDGNMRSYQGCLIHVRNVPYGMIIFWT